MPLHHLSAHTRPKAFSSPWACTSVKDRKHGIAKKEWGGRAVKGREEIRAAFLQAVNEVVARKTEIVDACSKVLLALSDTENLEREAEHL